MNSNGLGNLDDLFQSAEADGLTADTLDLMISNLNGPTMATAVGIPLDQLSTNEVTLAMNIIDMSGSMAPHAQHLINAYNQDYLAAMAGSTSADDILVSTILFDDHVKLLHGYLPLPDTPQLTRKQFDPNGATALYDAIAGGITNMVLYAQQLRQSGVMVRGLILVYTDGEDNSSKQKASDIQKAVAELLRQEIYTIALIGFSDTGSKQMGFKAGAMPNAAQQIAKPLGIPHALMAGLSHQELRRIFHLASQSTLRVSQQKTAATAVFI